MISMRINLENDTSSTKLLKQWQAKQRYLSRLSLLLLPATLFFIQACAIPAAEKPKPYTGTDTVGTFTASDIVGTWRMTPLSTTTGPDNPVAIITIKPDGTAVASTRPPEGAEINFEFESSGTWEIVGDRLSTAMSSMREVSGNQAAAFIGSVVSGFISKDQLSGNANPYVLTAERMVLVAENGYALQYDRIR